MNERQRDLFLYIWSRRRAPGQQRVALRGALIGAAGGLVFALVLLNGGATTPGGVAAYDHVGQIMSAARVLFLSIPAFAFLGWIGAGRVFAAQEAQYQALIEAGHQPPAEKPVMTTADRWPAMMVGATVLVIAGFIGYLFWASSTGNL